MKPRFLRVIGILAVLALVLAACGGDGETEATDAPDTPEATDAPDDGGDDMETSEWGLPIIDPLDVTEGDVAIAGSSTVYPLTAFGVLARWIDEGGPEYTVDSIGSSGGLERFCVEGASDIANASRKIKDTEVTDCAATWGSDPIEIRVGTDALSLVISPGNTFASELTLEQIGIAFGLPAGSTWADVDASFPAHPLETYSPGTDSGTFDFFFETVYPVIYDEEGTAPILEGGANLVGEDDNLTVDGVAEDGCTEGDTSTTCAIGYFGYAYYQENADVLEVVSVDAGEGDGPILPSDESVNANTYPISRPLYMYTSQEVVSSKPQVAEFIAYYLNIVNEVIGDIGYFPAPDDALQEAADNIKAAAGW